jgi:hypothetical protein
MEEINKFLEFINENLEDERISVYKEMKYGYRHYYISITIKSDVTGSTFNSSYNSYSQLLITLDNRNKCVVMNNTNGERSITIENDELLDKWSEIFENHLNQNIDKDIRGMIHDVMSKVLDKDLYRDYQMKKIFKKDEPI